MAASLTNRTTSRTVWKFSIPFPPKSDTFQLEMPDGAIPLAVHLQFGEPQIWALVDPQAPKVKRAFRIAGTGDAIDEDVRYVGTFQVANGSLVFHIFEVR